MAKSAAWTRKEGQNPNGGLNAKGRASAKKEGHNLKAPVNRKPKTAEEYRRQGSFLVRMGSSDGPLYDDKGRPTRLKKSLEVWNYHGSDKAAAVAMGRRDLAKAKAMKESEKGKKKTTKAKKK